MRRMQVSASICAMLLWASCGRIGYDPVSQEDDGGSLIDGSSLIDAPAQDAAVDPDLLVWIAFEGNAVSGTVDRQGTLSNGMCEAGRCPSSAAGVMGNAYKFDGIDDYLQFATVDALDFGAQAQPFTVSLWYRASVGGLAPPTQRVLMAQSMAAGSVAYQLSFEDVQAGAAMDLVWKVCRSDCQSGAFAINDDLDTIDSWVFVAATWDGSTTRLYVNAKEISSAPKATVNFDGSPFMVGADLETGNSIEDTFAGAIDDLRIYRRALSIADQELLMSAAAP